MGDSIDALLIIDERSSKNSYSLKIYCDNMLAKSDTELALCLQATQPQR